tara:strand:+ start:560 stop:1180 length:621 start_codon:yes stop_codon:yes gene_type:complete
VTWLILSNNEWPKEALSLITIATSIYLTGGLHFDGLMDTADGIAAGEKRSLEAMQDSRVGASGVQAFILVLVLQLAALIKLGYSAPIALPIATFWGRVSPLWAIGKFEYLHQERNNSLHKMHWKGLSHEIKPTLFSLVIIIFLLLIYPLEIANRLNLFISISIGILPVIIVPTLIGNKLKGHSGDSYGASLVIVETLILILMTITL